MVKNLLLIGIAAFIAVFAIAAVACDDDDDDSSEGGAQLEINDTPVAAVSVRITSPDDGSTVTSPVTVEVVAEGVVIAPAADGLEGAGHFAVAVDGESGSLAVGQVIARGEENEGLYQFAAGSVVLELEPGEHSVAVGIADNEDRLFGGVTLAEVTFTVEEAAED